MEAIEPERVVAACIACGRLVEQARCSFCGAARWVREDRVERVLSTQAHSRVYLTLAADGSRRVLKELTFSRVPHTQALEAFHREAELLRQLSHPHIPTFLDAFQEGTGVETRLYLAMSYMEGVSLQQALESHRFEEAEVLELAARGLELLVYLHGLSPPVLHRDLKPANLLRRPEGPLALVDFGAAREVHRTPAGHTTVVGTPGYMPPEQFIGVTTPGGDVYALGATLIHLLSRKPPAELLGEDLRLEFREHVNLSGPALRWLERLVHRSPRKRFASAARALEALEALRSKRAPRWRPLAAVAGGLGVTGALVVGLSGNWHRVEPPAAATPSAALAEGALSLEITCPSGTTRVDEPLKHNRWCGRLSTDGQMVHQGPLVRWDDRGVLTERSHYMDNQLDGLASVFKNGKLSSEASFHEGHLMGRRVTYRAQGGGMEHEERYENGVREGLWRDFDSNGLVTQEGTYHQGLKQGITSQYIKGIKVAEFTSVDDKPQGPFTSWYFIAGKRQVQEQGEYAAGEKTGTWVTYFSEGQKQGEGRYEGGRQQGAWSFWHIGGGLAAQGTYVNGVKEGPWLSRYPNGKMESEGSYTQGKQVGHWTQWYPTGIKLSEVKPLETGGVEVKKWHDNGQLESEGLTVKNEREGKWTTWFANGRKHSLTVYHMDRQQGLATTWHENGQKASEGRYERGNEVGTWQWWQPDGKLQRVENF